MRASFWLALLLVSVAGCGDKKPDIAHVSGRVTLDNEPLVGAKVTFQPIAQEGVIAPGPGSWAETDADGRYTLQVVGDNREGAVVGMHRVEISLLEQSQPVKDDDRSRTRNRVPARYNFQSDLQREVPPAGTRELDFELTTK
jgi:hypothetical protein